MVSGLRFAAANAEANASLQAQRVALQARVAAERAGLRPSAALACRPAPRVSVATNTDPTPEYLELCELRAEVARLREALRAEGHRSEPDDHLHREP